MRYYFHLESDTNVQIDPQGVEFDRYQDAWDHAQTLARDLGTDPRWRGWRVSVVDAHNTQIFVEPIMVPSRRA